MDSTIGTGHVACASIGSGPHAHTVAGVGAADDDDVARRRDGAAVPSGRELARVRLPPVVVERVRAPG
ncbi:hypothetical protein BS329_23770 [Amycolatopsis coloradensis]|uniref:Uncharacterized protein n=1 Tax=Amycolatopsis coloradensis TaxID=76021 RepID=A0A1R0KP08_9PSEU|nr:hypothetical protein BS329_23770 [Amycolatopsis coloradensis]